MRLINDDLMQYASLSATSGAAGFAIANAKNDLRGKTWRSTTLADQTITATFAATQMLDGIALALTNLTDSATIRAKFFTNTGDTIPVYDSGILPNSGDYFSHFFDPVSCKKITVLISDSTNPDGFLDIVRIIAGLYFEQIIDNGGVSISYSNDSVISKNGGNTQIDERVSKKIISTELEYLDINEQMQINNIKNYNAGVFPVFAEIGNEQIYGYFQELNSKLFTYHAYNFNLTLKEI